MRSYTASDRLAAKYNGEVKAKERRRRLTVTAGFETADRYLPVYERSVFNREWRELHPLADAASEVGEMLNGEPA